MVSKKGQGWGFDLMIAMTIFIIGITVFYFYALNYPSEGSDTLDNLFYDGTVISDLLLTEGFPRDWNETNVIQLGILSDNKVNLTKLERLYNLTWDHDAGPSGELDQIGYTRTKGLFNIRFEYFFNFSKNMDTIDPARGTVPYIGKHYEFDAGVEPENLIKVTRFTIYDNKPSTLNIFIWG